MKRRVISIEKLLAQSGLYAHLYEIQFRRATPA